MTVGKWAEVHPHTLIRVIFTIRQSMLGMLYLDKCSNVENQAGDIVGRFHNVHFRLINDHVNQLDMDMDRLKSGLG